MTFVLVDDELSQEYKKQCFKEEGGEVWWSLTVPFPLPRPTREWDLEHHLFQRRVWHGFYFQQVQKRVSSSSYSCLLQLKINKDHNCIENLLIHFVNNLSILVKIFKRYKKTRKKDKYLHANSLKMLFLIWYFQC